MSMQLQAQPKRAFMPVWSGLLQRKLAIGATNDPLEQEADQVANQVMTTSAHAAVRGTPLRIQRYAGQPTGQVDTAPASIDRVLASLGRPLEPALQQDMSQRFGHDFSQVRVHSGAAAEQSAREVSARAYTVGRDIVFGGGQFVPGTHEGRRLLAHELTHVVQQTGSHASPVIQRQPHPDEAADSSTSSVAQGTGDVSVYVGATMTAEAALREIYRKGARKISEEALRMVVQGTSIEDAARWANQARNELKVAIRTRGSAIVRGFAEARNIRKYGNKVGPAFEELIRQGKTPEDIIGSAGRASRRVNHVASKLRVGGRFFIAIDLAIVTWEVLYAEEGERLRTAVAGGAGIAGAAAGGWAGAKGGAAIGAFFGPIGAGVGGVIGGIGGALLGGWLAREAAEKAYDLVDDLVNPSSSTVGGLQNIVIDGIEEEYIRSHARSHP